MQRTGHNTSGLIFPMYWALISSPSILGYILVIPQFVESVISLFSQSLFRVKEREKKNKNFPALLFCHSSENRRRRKKMLAAVFQKSIAKTAEPLPAVKFFGTMMVPEVFTTTESVTAMKDLQSRFEFVYPSSIAIHNLPSCILASKLDEQSITRKRYLSIAISGFFLVFL